MKNLFGLLLLLLACQSIHAQVVDYKYYDKSYTSCSKDKAQYIKKIIWDDKSKVGCKVITYRSDQVIMSKVNYKDYQNKVKRDTSFYYELNGHFSSQTIYSKDNKKFIYKSFHYDGTLDAYKMYQPDGISCSIIEYSPFDKVKRRKKIVRYGDARVEKNQLVERIYFKSDSLLTQKTFFTILPQQKLERAKALHYQDGNLFYKEFRHTNSQNYNQLDSLYSYFENGDLKRKEYFDEKLAANNVCYNEKGEEVKFTPLFQDAAYKTGEEGMIEWLVENIQYPKKARRKGIEGTVYVDFVVCTDGTLCQFKVARGVHKLMDEEVMNALKKMPSWKPGMVDGKKVRTHFTLPVQFASEE